MADLSDRGSECDEMENRKDQVGTSSSEECPLKRTCTDCGTSKTPLWRGGPAGPKSLCNACGIRNRKRRRALLGLNNSKNKAEEKKSKKNNIGDSLKRRILQLGRQVLLEKQSKSKLGEEEEQAALLLMTLSYGSVYA